MAAAGDARTVSAAAAQTSRDLGGTLDALARVREHAALPHILADAGRELCGVARFDRVMVSHVSKSTWSPQTLFVVGGDGRVVVDLDDEGSGVDDLVIPLTSPMVEAEVVRRRLPALVLDAADEPRAHRPLVERTGTKEYVVAPVVVGGVVIGLLHADARGNERPLTDLDRDLLRIFADGVGLVYEREELLARVERQRRAVAEACEAALDGLAGRTTALRPELTVPVSIGEQRTPIACHDGADEPRRDGARLARLTAREREVLALLASGATNAQLADQLTVAESTVKSHVKHILHKLGAGNRAAAIACYLRETRHTDRRPR